MKLAIVILIVLGIVALVVLVYTYLQSLAAGLEKSSRNTGDPRNLMIVRKGSTAESSSQVSLAQVKMITYLPQIERDEKGRPLVSADLVVLISLPRADGTASGIPGEVPGLIAPPGGCRFHPRCERAGGPCREVRPPVDQLGGGHWVRCYHPHREVP